MAQKFKTSPKGIFSFPRVNTPDTKFDADGAWQVGLVLPREEAAPFIAEINAQRKESIAEAQKEHTKGKKPKVADPPFTENDDGTVTFKFKARASGTRKKDNTRWEFKLPVFDKFGKPWDPKVIVGGGTAGKVSYEITNWYVAAHGSGVKLNLKAVQVLDLVAYQGGSADSYGFSSEDSEGAEAEDPFGEGDAEESTDDDTSGDDF